MLLDALLLPATTSTNVKRSLKTLGTNNSGEMRLRGTSQKSAREQTFIVVWRSK